MIMLLRQKNLRGSYLPRRVTSPYDYHDDDP